MSRRIYHVSELNEALKCNMAANYRRHLHNIDIADGGDKRAANIGNACHGALERMLEWRVANFQQFAYLTMDDLLIDDYIEVLLQEYAIDAEVDIKGILLEPKTRAKIMAWIKGYIRNDPFLLDPEVVYLPELNFVAPVGNYLIGGRADALRLRPNAHTEEDFRRKNWNFLGATGKSPAQTLARSYREMMFAKSRTENIATWLTTNGFPYDGNFKTRQIRKGVEIDLIDFKTGAMAPTPFYMRHNLQFDIYAYALAHGLWYKADDRLSEEPSTPNYLLPRQYPASVHYWKVSDYAIRQKTSKRMLDAMTPEDLAYFVENGAEVKDGYVHIPPGGYSGRADFSTERVEANDKAIKQNILNAIRGANTTNQARTIPAFMAPCDMCRWSWLCDYNIKPSQAADYLAGLSQE